MDNELNDEQIDQLVSEETPSRDIPMREEAPEQQPTSWAEDTFKVGGKDIKATREQILQWASMGYNYPQRANELNQKEEQWKKTLAEKEKHWSEMEQKLNPYREIDEYAAKNPDWWAQIQDQYKQKISQAETNPEIAQLKQELADLKKFKSEFETEKQSLKVQEEDKALAQEVDAIRKLYPNLDFTTPDGEGKNLEMKVLEHAMNNGIQSFKVAFRDYYHDQLVAKAKDEGKETATKEVQKRSKLGILSESSKPTKGLKLAENVRGKSYNELMQEALDELKSS